MLPVDIRFWVSDTLFATFLKDLLLPISLLEPYLVVELPP